MKRACRINYFTLLFLFGFFPAESMAVGFGFNVTGGKGSTTWDANSYHFLGPSDNDFHFKTNNERAGRGILFDTALGSNRVFNYRLNIGTERVDYKINKVYRYRVHPGLSGTFETKGWFMSHDFGFKVFKNRSLRLWVGPELRISRSEGRLDRDRKYEIDISTLGIGPVVGLNLNMGNTVCLTLKIGALAMISDGELDNNATGEDWDILSDENSYKFANVGLVFRFGEGY